ncbi:hypothetical protein C0J52_05913 [Blattella germanica]|nr:hypothetical protein C0J52_05913 [Blattella germanica]
MTKITDVMDCQQWILNRETYKDQIILSEDVYTVGRGKENLIKCLSLYVSRQHCKIIKRDDRLTICFLDDKAAKMTKLTEISKGSRLHLVGNLE